MPDELGDDRERRRVPRRAAGVVLVVLVVTLAGDRWVAHREASALMRCVETGAASVTYTDRRIAAMVSYASPQLFRASTTARVRASLQSLVADTAASGLPSVRRARETCAGDHQLPWHRTAHQAALALLAYLDACRAHLERAAADWSSLGVPDRARQAARDRARRLLVRVVSGSDAARVEALLSP